MSELYKLQHRKHLSGIGVQMMHFYPNGYGVSVVNFEHSYGSEDGLFEVAVLNGSAEDFDIVYDTGITEDAEGYLTLKDVNDIMEKVKNLNESKAPSN